MEDLLNNNYIGCAEKNKIVENVRQIRNENRTECLGSEVLVSITCNQFSCPVCDEYFESWHTQVLHCITLHPKNFTMCGICFALFRYENQLLNHFKIFHAGHPFQVKQNHFGYCWSKKIISLYFLWNLDKTRADERNKKFFLRWKYM